MESISIVLALAIIAGCNLAPSSAVYTYEIDARKTGQMISQRNQILYMADELSPGQNLTYLEDIGDDEPFMLESSLNDGKFYVFKNGLNAVGSWNQYVLITCSEYNDDTWRYVVTKILKQNLIPDGTCSVKKGSYNAPMGGPPFTVNFSEMIACGDYMLQLSPHPPNLVNPNRKMGWAFFISNSQLKTTVIVTV